MRGIRSYVAVLLIVAIAVFAIAFAASWLGHVPGLPPNTRSAAPPLAPSDSSRVGTSGMAGPDTSAENPFAGDIDALRDRDLLLPIEGAEVQRWKGSFAETHSGHRHEAVDILAPRNTPIHAVDDGRIAKLFESKAGGLTVYQRDPSGRFIYYYAHLERYADLHEGDPVTRGEVIGYVGTSGDAPPDTPHLHFTIFRLTDPKRWWEGTAIDPYLVYSRSP